MQPEKHKTVTHISQHILEVRFRPTGAFLNVAGRVADYFFDKNVFKHWQIAANRVDFRDEQGQVKKFGAFFSFRNAGYITFNPETKNLFVDKASSFWRHALENPHFPIPEVLRFGYRSKVFIRSTRTFDDVRDRLAAHTLTDELKKLSGGEVRDIGLTVDVTEAEFQSRFQIGPVKKGEAEQYFSFGTEDFDAAGLYVDLDIYSDKELTARGIPDLLKRANDRLWERVDSLYVALEL